MINGPEWERDDNKRIRMNVIIISAASYPLLIIRHTTFKYGRAMLRHEWAGSTAVIPRPHIKPTLDNACFVFRRVRSKYKSRNKEMCIISVSQEILAKPPLTRDKMGSWKFIEKITPSRLVCSLYFF
uniref:SFRICE_016472 n=1 Tax=Spodoptera frugiperda TaxID=7108 RepID=A0A2H1X253_SPOFR